MFKLTLVFQTSYVHMHYYIFPIATTVTSITFIFCLGSANMVTGPTRNLWQAAKTWCGTANYNPLKMMPSNKGLPHCQLYHCTNCSQL